jgi:flavin-dependent dehydrogenase
LKRWGARQHFRVRPWADHVEVWWGDGVEAYITPSGPERVQVALLWDGERFKPLQGGAELVTSALPLFPGLSERLAGAERLSGACGLGPLAHRARTPTGRRLVLVGDALGYVDGITGEGLSAGFLQAEAIGTLVPGVLSNPTEEALAPLGRRLGHIYQESFTLVGLALQLSDRPRLRRLVMRGLSRAPRLFGHFLDANMGIRSPWRLPLTALPAFAWGLMHPAKDPLDALQG